MAKQFTVSLSVNITLSVADDKISEIISGAEEQETALYNHIEQVIDEMDYLFNSNTDRTKIVDPKIRDFKIIVFVGG